MAQNKSLEDHVVNSLAVSEGIDLLAEIAETGLDALLDDGLLRDVPVLSSIVGLFRASRTVRDHLFLKKLARFLLQLRQVPAQERAQFVARLETEPGKRRIGETLVLLLDRLDDFEKTAMLAQFFAGYIRGELSFDEFRLLASALDRIPAVHVGSLCEFYKGAPPDSRRWDNDLLQHSRLRVWFESYRGQELGLPE